MFVVLVYCKWTLNQDDDDDDEGREFDLSRSRDVIGHVTIR